MSELTLMLWIGLGAFALFVFVLFVQLRRLNKTLRQREAELKNSFAIQNTLHTELDELKKQIEVSIMNDRLTGLPARKIFEDRLAQILNQSKRHHLLFAVLFLGLDGFEMVNDALGMDVGDTLLKQVAVRLRASIRRVDTVSRFSGDGFAFLLPQLAKPETAAYVAQRLLDVIAQPFHIHGQDVFITASIGIAVHPNDGDEPVSLIRFADSALHQAKIHGHNHYQFYHKDMYGLSQREFALNAGLRKASVYQEFLVYYQPQVTLEFKKIINMGVVLCWQHPDFGFIRAPEFMHLAENSGMAIPIGEWVLRSACQQLQVWKAHGFQPDTISLTISLRQLENPHFTYRIMQIIKENNLDPSHIVFEIAEAVLLSTSTLVGKNLHLLRQLGIRLGVNDLGTGNIALQNLRSYPIDYIKIAPVLVQEMTVNKESYEIVKMIIALGEALRLKVIADGVLSETQKELLQSLGCRLQQGGYFSQLLSSQEFTSAIENHIVQLS